MKYTLIGLALLGLLGWYFYPQTEVLLGGDSGAKVAGTATSAGNWTNFTTTRVNTSDNSSARCANAAHCDAGTAEAGVLSSFAFGIPSGATIDGIAVAIEAKCINGDVSCGVGLGDLVEAALSWNNGSTWTTVKQSTETTTTDTVYTLGGVADTWGRSWTDTEFADGTFQLSVGAECNSSGCGNYPEDIDLVTVTAYYTAAGAPASRGVVMTNGQIKMIDGSIKMSI